MVPTSDVRYFSVASAMTTTPLSCVAVGCRVKSMVIVWPMATVTARDALRCCQAALEELPEICGHVFLLHRVDGMAQCDVASALGIPKRTVERYIAKALAHCLKRVQPAPRPPWRF